VVCIVEPAINIFMGNALDAIQMKRHLGVKSVLVVLQMTTNLVQTVEIVQPQMIVGNLIISSQKYLGSSLNLTEQHAYKR